MKKSSVVLLTVLLTATAILLVVMMTDDKGKSKELDEFLHFDREKASKIILTQNGEELLLEKEDGTWRVQLDEGRRVDAMLEKVEEVMGFVERVKPTALFSRSTEDVDSLQLSDSVSTRIESYEGKRKVVDIIVGKTEVKDRNAFFSYIKKATQDEIYVVQNLFSYQFFSKKADFRNQVVTVLDEAAVKEMKFSYLEDTFTLTKGENGWELEGTAVPEENVNTYLQAIRGLRSTYFDDEFSQEGKDPERVILIKEEADKVITLWLYKNRNTWLINSSANEEAFFSEQSLVEKLCKERLYFLTPPPEKEEKEEKIDAKV